MTYEFQKFPRSNIVKFPLSSATSRANDLSPSKLRATVVASPVPRQHLYAHWHVNSGTGRLEMRWQLTDDEIGLRWVTTAFDRLMVMLTSRRLRIIEAG
ncbi:MAG: hypothetical protein BGP09_24865 [Rhizobium sp. 60-20]|nr:MAG: hypothetical protein BGP09_24865 [Rhizobium sp. 60-20]